MSNKMVELIANGTITIDDLANMDKYINDAKLVKSALANVSKKFTFPFGTTRIEAYRCKRGDFDVWADLRNDGTITFWESALYRGARITAEMNLNNFQEVFTALESDPEPYDAKLGIVSCDLRTFLRKLSE